MAEMGSRTVIRLAAWTGVAVIGGAAIYGVASAAPSPPSTGAGTVNSRNVANDPAAAAPEETDATQAHWGRHRQPRLHRFLAGRVLHGEFVVATKDGGTKTVAVQKGEVTAVGSDTVTVKSRDGYTLTWRVNDDTKVRKGGKKAELSDLATGDRVAAIGEKTNAGVTARAVVARTSTGR